MQCPRVHLIYKKVNQVLLIDRTRFLLHHSIKMSSSPNAHELDATSDTIDEGQSESFYSRLVDVDTFTSQRSQRKNVGRRVRV